VLVAVLRILWTWVVVPVGGVGVFAIAFLVVWGSAIVLRERMRVRTARRYAQTLLQSRGCHTAPSHLPALLASPDPETRKAAAWIASKGVKSGAIGAGEIAALVLDHDPGVAAEAARILGVLGALGKAGKTALFDRLVDGPPELRGPILSTLHSVGVGRADREQIKRIVTASVDWTKDQQASLRNLKYTVDQDAKAHVISSGSMANAWLIVVAVFIVIAGIIGFIVTVAIPFLFGR